MAAKKTPAKSNSTQKTTAKPVKKTTPKKTVSKSTAKSKAAKATVSKSTTVHNQTDAPVSTPAASSTASTSSKKGFRIKKSYIILAVTVLAIGALLYFGRGLFVAAVVNGEPIWRISVVQETEKQAGKQVMATLVRYKLIEQEARKQNVTVSEQEVDDEVKKYEANLQKQGQQLDQFLALQGITRDQMRKLIRLDKMVSKMVGKDINITDQQVNEYIEQNKEALPQDQSEAELKTQVKEQLKQQQLNEKVRVWLENLQKNAKVNQIVTY